MLEVNMKDTRTSVTLVTLFWCRYCQLLTYFWPFSDASIVDLEEVNVCSIYHKTNKRLFELMRTFSSYILSYITRSYLTRLQSSPIA